MKPVWIDDDTHARFSEFCKKNPTGKLGMGDAATKILDKVTQGLMIDISGIEDARIEALSALLNIPVKNSRVDVPVLTTEQE